MASNGEIAINGQSNFKTPQNWHILSKILTFCHWYYCTCFGTTICNFRATAPTPTTETKQTQALLSNKPSSTFNTVKYTMSIQSDYCDCFYCHCPVASPWLSLTPSADCSEWTLYRQRLLIKNIIN